MSFTVWREKGGCIPNQTETAGSGDPRWLALAVRLAQSKFEMVPAGGEPQQSSLSLSPSLSLSLSFFVFTEFRMKLKRDKQTWELETDSVRQRDGR